MKRTEITLLPLVAVLLATATWSISSHARATAQEEIAELDLAAAEVGTWWLELEGEETTCRALFTVSEPTPRRS